MATTEEKSNRVRGDGSVYARGNTLWVAFYRDGKLHRESAKTADPDEALKHLRKCTRAADKAEGAGLEFQTPKLRKRRLSELIEALRSDYALRDKLSPQNASNFKRIDRDFGAYRANALTSEDVDRYIERRQADGDAVASINRHTQLLRQCYVHAKFPESFIPRCRHLSEVGNERRGFFSTAEIGRVIENLPQYLRPFTKFAWLCGMRKHEISTLQWANVDGDMIVLEAKDAKNGHAREVPIEGEVADVIEQCRRSREIRRRGKVVSISNLIFHTPDGRPIREFRKTWRRACCKAAVGEMICPRCELGVDENFRCAKCGTVWYYEQLQYRGRLFHDLRRSAVRNMTLARVSQQVAMEISGHRTPSMFRRYNIVDLTQKREAMRMTQTYLQTVEEKVQVMATGK